MTSNTPDEQAVPYKKKKKKRIVERDIKRFARKNSLMQKKLEYQRRLYSIFKPDPIAAIVSAYVQQLRQGK